MTENPNPKKRLNLKTNPPAPLQTYLDLVEMTDEFRAYLADQSRDHPVTALLLGGAPPQFAELAPDTIMGWPAVLFRPKARKHTYGPRWATPGGMLVMRALLLYGGGLNVNESGTGYSYVRMWGPIKQNVQLSRLLVDVKPGEFVQQRSPSGGRTNFRVNDSAFCTTTDGEPLRVGKRRKAVSSPYAGRAEATANALEYHRRHNGLTDIGLSVAEYQAFIEQCFAILDALHEAREAKLRLQAA